MGGSSDVPASGFTRFCGKMATEGWKAAGRFLASYSKAGPKRPGRAAGNAGCLLLFPLVTLFVWMLQGLLWLVVAAPIATWAALWSLLALAGAVGDGLRHRRVTRSESR